MMAELDFAQARFNMVEQQVRTWDVFDAQVLDLLASMPREEFVPLKFRNLAYADIGVRLAHGQVMMHPIIEARLLQALALKPTDVVLEIGTGSGYITALLAKMAAHVYSVEIYPDLLREAARRLQAHQISNVTLEEGDGSHGWPDHGPYDAIAITGSLNSVNDKMKGSLKIGGRLFAIVGEGPAMEAQLITRVSQDKWDVDCLFETELKVLVNATKPPRFVF